MKLNSFEGAVTCVGFMVIMAIIKWIWNTMKQGQNTLEEDNDATMESSSTARSKYDVFLSFRGPDTRKGITSELYYQLQNEGIQTFMDDQDLEVGDSISPELLKAIEDSSFAIIVLSQNYAVSTWCLEELTKICECMKDNKKILPLFYYVEPTDVRYQKKSFKDAFTNHINSGRYKSKTILQWRDALNKVANFTGWTTQEFRTERELVERIVEDVYGKVASIEINRRDFQELETRKEAMEKIMGALEDDEVTAVGVYGMGGIGKTTMVKHVSDEARRKGTFRHVIMAGISHSPDLKKIQGILADRLAIQLKDQTETGRDNKLSKAIKRKNKMLIILDDIWEAIDLSIIGIPSYKELQNCNSKILFTTRSLDVCKSMESQQNILLDVLSDQDSWKFFVTITKLSFEIPSPFYNVARDVARGCAGLPIALEAVAKALKEKEMNEWNEAARRLKVSQPATHDDVRVFNCVKFSYDCLRSEDAKSCFLLCCLFPQEYDIQIEDLLTYGFGKGLFQNCLICNTLKDARDIVHSEVRYLKSSGLLLGGKHDGQTRMHDVIRQMAILISFSEDGQRALVKAGCKLQKWPKINPQAGYYAISLMMNKIPKLPQKFVCPKLQILLLQHNPDVKEIPDSFLESLNELRVLDLSKTSISSLPQNFELLNNLHTLYLDSCEPSFNISVLGKLEKLEILSLRECCHEGVPKEIGDLANLRMLDITESRIVKIASNVISRLRELEELYLQCNFEDWGCKVEEAGEETNVHFDELVGLPYLTSLKVHISHAKFLPTAVEVHPDWERFDICISNEDVEVIESTWKPRFSRDDSRTLTLSTTIHTLPEWFINVVTKKAEKLQYRKCKALKNILVEHDRGGLQELRHLSIIGRHENLKEVMNAETWDSKERVFENLEELHLFDVDNIEKLCVGELPSGSLCNLMLLDVRWCHNLVNALLQSSLLERLQYLEKLLCAHMDGVEFVFEYGKTTICEKLQEVRLCYLPKLIKIWNGHAPHSSFHNLKILAVSRCKKLTSLFTSDVTHCLLQLEDLWVYSCPNLNRVVEASDETEHRSIIFPKLKNLVLVELKRLSSFYTNSSGSATSLAVEFPSLEHFHMRGCHDKFSPFASAICRQKQVQFNSIQHYSALQTRLWGDIQIVPGDEEWKYDVFLSFWGPDSRRITYELYDRLQRRGIKTFKDDGDPVVGDVISRTLTEAIEESRFAIVVLSQNYASSTRCLEELRTICECMKDRQGILPLFYYVNPTDVRYQQKRFGDAFTKPTNSRRHKSETIQQWKDALNKVASFSGWNCMKRFADAFTKPTNSRRHKSETIRQWRDALNKVASFFGWICMDIKTEYELVDSIVEFLYNKLLPDAITADFEAFEATRKAMDEVIKAAKDDKVTAVGVFGRGGVGKTTMVKHVAMQAFKKGIFDQVIMAVVSERPDFKRVQQTLAKQLGFEFKRETEIGRAARLRKEIMRRSKILIILNDIWERMNLSSLGIPSPNELRMCNSKVLLTTRRLNVWHVMECQRKISLNALSEEDSWALFVRNAGRSFESNFKDVAMMVARECCGLPIALIAVARALGDKKLQEWKRAARALKNSQFANPDGHGEASKCIKLSYDYLKDEDSKLCFLFCACLFPEYHDIQIEDLFQQAYGKGLFRDADTIEEARGKADSVVRYLKDSSLLLDSEEDGCVRMHPVVRDTALRIASSEDRHGFLVKADFSLQSH